MRNWIILICFLWAGQTFGQAPFLLGNPGEVEPISLNYGQLPDLGGTEIANYGLNFNFARPLGKGVLGIGLGYEYLDFSFSEATNVIDLSTYENMHTVRSNLSYVRPLKNRWGVIISAGTSLMSNLGDGVTTEDFVVNAILGFTKRWGDFERNSSLLFGAFYGTQLGEPTVLPAVSFRQKLNEHWSYSLGIPITGINYQINPKHRISLLASPQGFFGNNSNEVAVDGNRTLTNTKLQFNGINTRLSYRYLFTKNIAIVGEAGFVPNATLKILDDENEDIFDLDPGNGAYFNIGLRYVIQKNRGNINQNKKTDEN